MRKNVITAEQNFKREKRLIYVRRFFVEKLVESFFFKKSKNGVDMKACFMIYYNSAVERCPSGLRSRS